MLDTPARPPATDADRFLSVTAVSVARGRVVVEVVGEVDTFTAPLLRSVLDTHLQLQPTELVIDLFGIQFLGSAGLAVLVETHKSARDRDVGLRLIITTGAVARALTVTGLIDLFTVTNNAHR